MRLYLLGCLLALMALSGQSCLPQNPLPDDTTNNADNGDDNTGDDNTGDDDSGDDDTGDGDDQGTGNDGPQPAQEDHILGANSAKVTVIEYVDFQCPFCGRFARNTWPTIRQEYVQTGKVKWILRHFPLRSIHPYAEAAAQASECANNQGLFWGYADLLFEKQSELDALIGPGGEITDVLARLKTYAQDLSLDGSEFNTCLDSGSEAARVQRDLDLGTLNGTCQQAGNQNNSNCVPGTPTFFINGERHLFQSNDELNEIRGWLDAALDAAD